MCAALSLMCVELTLPPLQPGKKKAEACETCSGTKEIECNWCHGTGILTLGDQIIRADGIKAGQCPVCKGQVGTCLRG